MAVVKPFRAIRYAPQRVDFGAVLTPPAGEIDAEQARALYEREPRNAVRIVRNLPEPSDEPGAAFRRAAFFLADWRRAGVLIRDEVPSFYVLRQTFPRPSGAPLVRQGFFGAVDLASTDERPVRAHEQVDPAGVDVLVERLSAMEAQVEPLLLLQRDPDDHIARVFDVELEREADLRFTHDGVGHELWVIDDESTTARVTQLLMERPLYIADGHHRYQAALRYHEEVEGRPSVRALHEPASRFALAFICRGDDACTRLLPAHRIVTLSRDVDAEAFLDAARQRFSARPLGAEEALAEVLGAFRTDQVAFGVELPGLGPWLFELRGPEVGRGAGSQTSAPCPDAMVVQRALLEEILGLEGEELPGSVEVVPDHAEAYRLPRLLSERQIGFLLRPPSLARLMDLSDEGELMPPKSTCFFPKLPAGLVFAPLLCELRA